MVSGSLDVPEDGSVGGEPSKICLFSRSRPGRWERSPATLTCLPNGDTLLHAIAEFITGSGRALEGCGVEPEVKVAPKSSGWAAGRDVALETAQDWIAGETRRTIS
jgi:hypothetical protein